MTCRILFCIIKLLIFSLNHYTESRDKFLAALSYSFKKIVSNCGEQNKDHNFTNSLPPQAVCSSHNPSVTDESSTTYVDASQKPQRHLPWPSTTWCSRSTNYAFRSMWESWYTTSIPYNKLFVYHEINSNLGYIL